MSARDTQRGEGDAQQAVALLQQGRIVELDGTLALSAARISVELKLPMADSLMLAAAARARRAAVDAGFEFAAVPGVKYRAKARSV